MTFALGLALGLPLGAGLTLAALYALCAWMAARDDDPRPASRAITALQPKQGRDHGQPRT
jgi:hypothetical protein